MGAADGLSRLMRLGLGVTPRYYRTEQKIEYIFAANCVGHQVLVTLLIPLLKNTASAAGEARVVVTSSGMFQLCHNLDLSQLTSPARTKPACYDGVWRYARSKLGDILLTKELSRRLFEAGDTDPSARRIFVNTFFPGNIVTEQWSTWDENFGKPTGALMRGLFSVIGQSVQDGAATAMYLAASEDVARKDIRGEYFIPIAKPNPGNAIANDMELAGDLWVSFCLCASS